MKTHQLRAPPRQAARRRAPARVGSAPVSRGSAVRAPAAPAAAHSAGAGNHTRLRVEDQTSSREREAVEAASRFIAGEWDQPRSLARALGSAPVAAAAVPGSRAEPLPVRLRAELEDAFGADLDALRVHHDAAAGAAALSAGARAFASAAHLFFAPGAYAPSSLAGRQLIAHETAHALQQTGRRAG